MRFSLSAEVFFVPDVVLVMGELVVLAGGVSGT